MLSRIPLAFCFISLLFPAPPYQSQCRLGKRLIAIEESPEHALVWLDKGRRRVIDRGIDSPDLIPATLFGRHGVLLIQKRIQVRFYELPATPDAIWPSRDIYSIYTPSHQGGLALADIDGDGRTDILCGNYWIQAPAAFDLPWHCFAINTWTEDELSGMMRFAYRAPVLLAAQRELARGRVGWFTLPTKLTDQWPVRILGTFDHPTAIARAGDAAIVGESGGAKRLLAIRGDRTTILHSGEAVLAIEVRDDRHLLVTFERRKQRFRLSPQ